MNLVTRQEIVDKVPKLKMGSFTHWVNYKAGLQPIKRVPKGHFLVELYDESCIEKIKEVMEAKDGE